MSLSVARFIQYCEEGGGYTGFDYTDAEGEEDVVARLSALRISLESDGRCSNSEQWIQKGVKPLHLCVHLVHLQWGNSFNNKRKYQSKTDVNITFITYILIKQIVQLPSVSPMDSDEDVVPSKH